MFVVPDEVHLVKKLARCPTFQVVGRHFTPNLNHVYMGDRAMLLSIQHDRSTYYRLTCLYFRRTKTGCEGCEIAGWTQ